MSRRQPASNSNSITPQHTHNHVAVAHNRTSYTQQQPRACPVVKPNQPPLPACSVCAHTQSEPDMLTHRPLRPKSHMSSQPMPPAQKTHNLPGGSTELGQRWKPRTHRCKPHAACSCTNFFVGQQAPSSRKVARLQLDVSQPCARQHISRATCTQRVLTYCTLATAPHQPEEGGSYQAQSPGTFADPNPSCSEHDMLQQW